MNYVRYTLKGHYGSYDINDTVLLEENDERNPCDVLWGKYRRAGYLTLPMASTHLKVVKREYLPDNYDEEEE